MKTSLAILTNRFRPSYEKNHTHTQDRQGVERWDKAE
jgi:hypothetical protein